MPALGGTDEAGTVVVLVVVAEGELSTVYSKLTAVAEAGKFDKST